MKGKLTKYDELECFGIALYKHFGPGARVPIRTMYKVVAKTLGVITEKSYYNKMHELEGIFGCVKLHKKVCVEIISSP